MKIENDAIMLDLLGIPAPQLSPTIVQDAPHCVAVINPVGRIECVSTTSIQAMGLDDETQLVGRHWCKTWPSHTHAALAAAMDRALAGEIIKYWAKSPNSDGDMVGWDVRLSPISDASGTVISVLAVSCPVTMH